MTRIFLSKFRFLNAQTVLMAAAKARRFARNRRLFHKSHFCSKFWLFVAPDLLSSASDIKVESHWEN